MSDPAATPPARPRPTWPVTAALGLAAATPLALALAGEARMTAAAVASGVLALIATGVAILGRREPSVAPPPRQEPQPPAPPEPPFAVILEHILDPILLVADSGAADAGSRRFVFANAAARDLFRLQRSEGPLATAVRAPEVLTAVDEALRARETRETLYETRGVQERFWRVSVTPLAHDGGPPERERRALLILRDETEIRRSERTRADFLANASHELRTPLASLAGFIETLRGHARDDPEARERFLGIMHVQAERMRRLIDDLTSLSRIELEEHIAPSGRVDMATAAIDVVDALSHLALERGVALSPTLPPHGSAVAAGDRDQILQVIQNLIENAVKYTPRGETVAIDVLGDMDAIAAGLPMAKSAAHLSLLTPDHAPGQRYVAVRVRDVGPGIARSNLPRLTQRFYRVEGQKVQEKPGTGLGLAIVKHIVNRHRGGLTVESAEGQGSAFTAYFPQVKTADAVPTAKIAETQDA